jgi:hypothetical protein
MTNDRLGGHRIRGRGRFFFAFPETRTIVRGPGFVNDTLRDWARVLLPFYAYQANMPITPVNMVYIEFANAAAPIAVPTFTRTDPNAAWPYYSGLSGSPTKDVLRVPITAAVPFNDPSFGDLEDNAVRFHSRSSGVEGVHGKDFLGGTSVIMGIALVCAPDLEDWTKDIVHSRAYVEAEDQLVVPVGAQVHTEYDVVLD